MNYEPGGTVAHGLDPRTKIAFQAGFASAAFVHTTPRGLAAMTAVAAGVMAASGTPPSVVRGFGPILPVLVGAPLVEGVVLGPPFFDVGAATYPALASYRVLLLLVVGAAYVRTTRPRESRAAVQWLLPGRAGTLLGVGVSVVLRFLPVLRADLSAIRTAIRARLGDRRSVVERIRLVATAGLERLFVRSDRLALALRARCFAYNPTLPPLTLGRRDLAGLAAAAALGAGALL